MDKDFDSCAHYPVCQSTGCTENPYHCSALMQDRRCKYGYITPDRCRYTRHLGCDCGVYPPIPSNEVLQKAPNGD